MTNDQVFEFIQNKPVIQPMSDMDHDVRPGGSDLARAAAQFANGRNSPGLKSPVFVKLETMIETLHMFRAEMDGQRIPKF